MVRLLHLSDTHLGNAVYGSERRERDFTDAFVQSVEIAVDRGVDAVVHTGDLTDSHAWDEELPDRVVDALATLDGAGIPFYFVLGNHDRTETGRPQAWVGELTSRGLATRLSTAANDVGDVALYGVDYHDRDWWETGQVEFEPAIGDPTAVLCLHQDVEPFAPNGRGDLDLRAFLDEADVAFDAVVLGHKHETLSRRVDGTLATYAGTTERISRAERDNWPKVNLLTVDDGTVRREELSLETRPFDEVTVVPDPDADAAAVGRRLRESCAEGSVLTVYLVDGDDATVTASDLTEAVASLDPVDVDVRSVEGDGNLPSGVFATPPADVDRSSVDGRDDATDAAAAQSAAGDGAAVEGEGSAETDRTVSGDDSGVEAVGLPVEPDAPAEDRVAAYERYVAGLSPRDGACDFVFDPDRWAAHFDVAPERDRWACPQSTEEAEAGLCPFHAPVGETDLDPADLAARLQEQVESAAHHEFVGAQFASLDLSNGSLDAPGMRRIDLSYAVVEGSVDLSYAVVQNPLSLTGLSAARVRAEGATVAAPLAASGLSVAGSAEFSHAHFERNADFRDAAFQSAGFDDCAFEKWARFDEATFGGRATFKRTAFAGQTKFNHATFEGRAVFFSIRADQFVGFHDAEFQETATFYGAEFGPTTYLRKTTFRGDATFETATFGSGQTTLSGAVFERAADFTRVRFDGPVRFASDDQSFPPTRFGGPATFTRARFDDDARFGAVTFERLARFDRTRWAGRADFTADRWRDERTRFGGPAAFDEAEFRDVLELSGVAFDGLVSLADARVDGRVELVGATLRDGGELSGGRFGSLSLDGVAAPDGDEVVSLAGSVVRDVSLSHPDADPPLYDLTEARVGTLTVSGAPSPVGIFATLVLDRTEFESFEFSRAVEHIPTPYDILAVADRYESVPRPTLTAREREVTYRNAKNAADNAGDAAASSHLFKREMGARRASYRERLPADASTGERVGAALRWTQNWALDRVTGFGEQTRNVLGTSALLLLLAFPFGYALTDAVAPGSLAAPYSGATGYVLLSFEAFAALLLRDGAAVAGLARVLVYAEALTGTLMLALLVLTLTRSVYR